MPAAGNQRRPQYAARGHAGKSAVDKVYRHILKKMETHHYMHGEHYGGPGSFALVTISIVFAWISQMTMDQIAFIISAGSGLLACISFALRIVADWGRIKQGNPPADSPGKEDDNEDSEKNML